MSEFAGLAGVYGADPDAVVSLAAYVSRGWSYGVRLFEVAGLPGGGAIGACGHSDGSRWFVACDRYGSVRVDGDSIEEACGKLGRAIDALRAREAAAAAAEGDRVWGGYQSTVSASDSAYGCQELS